MLLSLFHTIFNCEADNFFVFVFVLLCFVLFLKVGPVPSLNGFAVGSVCLFFVTHPRSCHDS